MLFLVLPCDDVHMGNSEVGGTGPTSDPSCQELLGALNELYSAPGGGGNEADSGGLGVPSSVVGGATNILYNQTQQLWTAQHNQNHRLVLGQRTPTNNTHYSH